MRGIEVIDDTSTVYQIRAVCLDGPGRDLGAKQTWSRTKQDHVYPSFEDQTSPKEWDECGTPDLIARRD